VTEAEITESCSGLDRAGMNTIVREVVANALRVLEDEDRVEYLVELTNVRGVVAAIPDPVARADALAAVKVAIVAGSDDARATHEIALTLAEAKAAALHAIAITPETLWTRA
jgi:hypothetical protein